MELLAMHGADVNANRTDKTTALMLAAEKVKVSGRNTLVYTWILFCPV